MWQERVSEFVTLFVVINPLGALPVFLALAGDCNTTARRKMAVKAVVVAFVVLAFFAFGGSFLLRHMNISLNAFQIAGADNDRDNVAGKAMTIGVLVSVLLVQLGILWASEPVSRLIGKSGAAVIGRVMGMIVAALAVNIVLAAVVAWLGLPTL
jgi:multiple antibiotic resistance protein